VTHALDPERAIKKASALRALCLSLPHVPTPVELARLRRFEEIAARPESATAADTDALDAGWRRWWRRGEAERLRAMAALVPTALLDDRRLATYACAARHRASADAGPADA
jgi:hypothetical protein